MCLEVQAQVEQRLLEYTALAEQEREQKPPQPPVAVQKWMDGLELYMHQAELDQQRQAVVIQVFLKCIEAIHQSFGRGGDEKSISRSGSTDPVLAAPKFPRSLFAPPAPSQQYAMDLAQQAKRNRKPLFEPVKAVLNGCDIMRGFFQIVDKRDGTDSVLEQQQFR